MAMVVQGILDVGKQKVAMGRETSDYINELMHTLDGPSRIEPSECQAVSD